jgi:hypothetical protein
LAPASECHSDFITSTICNYDEIKDFTIATAEKIEDVLASMRSNLIRIINKWEQSGQVEGGRDPENYDNNNNSTFDDDDSSTSSHPPDLRGQNVGTDTGRIIGALTGRSARALQTRSAFLNGLPSYLLYFWEVVDKHQLLQTTLQRLDNSTGASDASLASITKSASRSKETQNATLTPLIESIKDLAEVQKQVALNQAEERKQLVLNLAEERRQNREGEERRYIIEQEKRREEMEMEQIKRRRDMAFQRSSDLQDSARKYRTLIAELDPGNSNYQRLST